MKTNKKLLLILGIFLNVLASGKAQTTFTKITNGAIVTDLGTYTRGAWGDFNNDGFLDLFVSSADGDSDDNRPNVFYLNNENGTFTKVTQGDPVQDAAFHTGAAAADYDNDGNLDLLVSEGVEYLGEAAGHNLIYHGNGDGTFSRASGGGLTNQLGSFDACAWADYDNDGFVDVLITDDGRNGNGGNGSLWHNNGNGTFTRNVIGFGVGYGALWADYDNDGFEDLLVIYDSVNAHNALYHNNRDGTFTQITTNVVTTDSWSGGAVGGAWGDYDNDGLPDLFVTDQQGVRNRLYHNNGNGNFTNVTSGPMLKPASSGGAFGCSWGDYDNDGYLDLITTGFNGTNGLYHNNGDGTFTQILSEPPVLNYTPDAATVGVAWVDYDNDGFLDLFITGYDDNTYNLLYHNNGNNNAWLEVKLVGTASNRSAIGAKVRVHATIDGKTFWQLREITGGGGWNLQPLVAHFGLGDATNVDTVRIEWPSGTVQQLQNIAAKQILTCTEPPRLLATTTGGAPQFSLKGGRGFQYEIDSSTDLSTWSSNSIVTITNLNGMAAIIDPNSSASSQRFYRAVSQ
jgi:hypothetical protein